MTTCMGRRREERTGSIAKLHRAAPAYGYAGLSLAVKQNNYQATGFSHDTKSWTSADGKSAASAGPLERLVMRLFGRENICLSLLCKNITKGELAIRQLIREEDSHRIFVTVIERNGDGVRLLAG